MALVLRKIRKGRVKVCGRWFKPRDQYKVYDGRLDGLRMAFGTYYTGKELQPYLSLWGSEAMFNAKTVEEIEATPWGPHCMEDGTFPWEWWDQLPDLGKQALYPCADCGLKRTAAEGGTTFTVCDKCWDKHYSARRRNSSMLED